MFTELADFFENEEDVCVAFLFGSRARGAEVPDDWDLAIQLNTSRRSRLATLARLEHLRSDLAKTIGCGADTVDLIDLRHAPLNLCVTVAEEGQVLKGRETLELFRFYQRAWSGQEEFHFRKANGY